MGYVGTTSEGPCRLRTSDFILNVVEEEEGGGKGEDGRRVTRRGREHLRVLKKDVALSDSVGKVYKEVGIKTRRLV